MKLTRTVDPWSRAVTFTLTITEVDYLLARRYDAFDRALLEDCAKSPRVADHLLALELIARHIEEGGGDTACDATMMPCRRDSAADGA